MKRMSIVVIDGEERELRTLPKEERQRIADTLNRRALAALGYVEVTKEEKPREEGIA